MSDAPLADDFDAAKKVFDEIRSLPKDRQERVLRWVAETLGVRSSTSPTVAPPSLSALGTASGDTTQGTGLPLPSTSRDIRTFVSEKAPTSDNQFAAVVAYYYRFEAPQGQRRDAIGGSELQDAARLAGRRRLSNPRQTLKNAKALGYLDNPARGEFSINTVGENLVAMTLPGNAESAARGVTKRDARTRRTAKKGRAKTKKSTR